MTKTSRITDTKYSREDIQGCIDVLQDMAANSVELAHLPEDQRVALMMAAGKISRPLKEEIRKRTNDRRHLKLQKIDDHERKVRAATGIRSAREAAVFTAPQKLEGPASQVADKEPELINPRNCYVCKQEFTRLHFFYDAMCPKCAEFNTCSRRL